MNGKLRQVFHELGLVDGCCYLLACALARASGGRAGLFSYRFFAQPLATAARCGARSGGIDVRPLPHPLACERFPRDAAVLRRRFSQGAHCLAAYRRQELTGFLWYCAGAYAEDEVRARFELPSCAVWDFDVQVLPAHQFGFTFARLWDEASLRLRAEGKRWSLSRISGFNRPSQRAHLRLGAIQVGRAVFVRGSRWQWMVSTVRPYLHLSFRSDAGPRLRLQVPAEAQ